MKYTKESKKQYFQTLRKDWQKAKTLSKTSRFEALFAEASRNGLRVSSTGFTFCKVQMDKLGLEGTPYIDTKTFKAWKESGFIVKKGERSKIKGVTFIKKDEEDDDAYMFPKMYSLFHRTQVEPIK